MGRLIAWCRENNVLFSITKTKKLIIEFRKKKMDIASLTISGDCVERVANFRTSTSRKT